ncbi:MJ0042-type zinc finger domain-containing protein [Candidatus Nitrososphaera gargensis]
MKFCKACSLYFFITENQDGKKVRCTRCFGLID